MNGQQAAEIRRLRRKAEQSFHAYIHAWIRGEPKGHCMRLFDDWLYDYNELHRALDTLRGEDGEK